MHAATAIALTIAGSDSSGGAGIQADLKTFAALGVYGASVITALTAQNTTGVFGIHDVPPEFVAQQIDAVFSDLTIGAVKIGMLTRADVIATVAYGLDRYQARNVVLDPVMVATSGDRLLRADAIEALRRELFPRALSHHAQSARSGGAARRRAGPDRSRDAGAGRTAACGRRQGRADQGRPRRGGGSGRSC